MKTTEELAREHGIVRNTFLSAIMGLFVSRLEQLEAFRKAVEEQFITAFENSAIVQERLAWIRKAVEKQAVADYFASAEEYGWFVEDKYGCAEEIYPHIHPPPEGSFQLYTAPKETK